MAAVEGRPCGFGGEERGPCGFGGIGEDHTALAERGPHGGNTADGAGSLNHRLLLLFPRYGTQTGQREKDCASVGILEDFSILMKTLTLSLCNF